MKLPLVSCSSGRTIVPAKPMRAQKITPPTTTLLATALPRVDWSDAYAVRLPGDTHGDPQEWADAIFRRPPMWVRLLFGIRESLVGIVGIEKGGREAFATVDSRPDEVLIGIDQRHLAFRASILVEPECVVLSTIVQVRNRRGGAYSALVRWIHPWVVRAMLARAARELGASACDLRMVHQ